MSTQTRILDACASAPLKSAQRRRKDTRRRLSGWTKGVMSDTRKPISRRRRFCAGVCQSSLHIANRLTDGPASGHAPG